MRWHGWVIGICIGFSLLAQDAKSKGWERMHLPVPECFTGPARNSKLGVLGREVSLEHLPLPYTICFTGKYLYEVDAQGKSTGKELVEGEPADLNGGPPNPDPNPPGIIEVFTKSGKAFQGSIKYTRVDSRKENWVEYWWRTSNVLIDTEEPLFGFRIIVVSQKRTAFEKTFSYEQFRNATPMVSIVSNKNTNKKSSIVYWATIKRADRVGISKCPEPLYYVDGFSYLPGFGGFEINKKSDIAGAKGIPIFIDKEKNYTEGWPVYVIVAWQGLNPYVKLLRRDVEWVEDPTIWERLKKDKWEAGKRLSFANSSSMPEIHQIHESEFSILNVAGENPSSTFCPSRWSLFL